MSITIKIRGGILFHIFNPSCQASQLPYLTIVIYFNLGVQLWGILMKLQLSVSETVAVPWLSFPQKNSLSHFYPRPLWPSGIVVACVCVSVCSCVRVSVCQSRACPHDNSPLVQARITKFGTKVQKTLVKVPIVFGDDRPWPSRSNLTWKSNFTSFWACPPHNSSAVHARITKFGPKMHLSTVKMPINFGQDWFWSSPSFLILKPIFLPNLFALCLYYI